MKTIIALIAASIALAAPASATPGEDQSLLYLMRLRNMYVGDAGITHALELAHRVCQDLEIDVPSYEVIQNLQELVPQWSQSDVLFFYGAATTTHCPSYV